MKLDILTFCLLCFHFEPLHGAENCSLLPYWKNSCKGHQEDLLDTNPQLNDLPRDTFILHCPLPYATNFHMKLLKGEEEICDLYFENKEEKINKTEFCVPVHSSGCEVKFLLRNLQSKHSDTYTCSLWILLPLYNYCKANEIYLHIKDPEPDPEPCLLSETMSWILIGLSVFSTAACICCFIVCCLRKVICQNTSPGSYEYSNEYMSMAAVKFN